MNSNERKDLLNVGGILALIAGITWPSAIGMFLGIISILILIVVAFDRY